jgi:aconitate hydratase
MGVLPLDFEPGQGASELGLDGSEVFDIPIGDDVLPRQKLVVTATKADGTKIEFSTTVRLDTPVDVGYYRNGGILHTVLRAMARS